MTPPPLLALAAEEARRLEHEWIGPEHLLLALLHDESGASRPARAALRLDVEGARVALAQRRPRGTGYAGRVFHPDAKRLLERALTEAQALGATRITADHLALATLAEPDGVAAAVLADSGIDASREAARLRDLLAAGPREGA